MASSVRFDQESPAWRILQYLQRNGTGAIKDLEQHLGVTTTAVRQQLQALQADGYVERKSVHAGVGRPHHEYSMTANAQDLFSHHSEELALTLLEEVFELEGKETTIRLLGRVSRRLAEQYAQDVESGELSERVAQLIKALADRGILADMTVQEEDVIILETYNCPYHEIAQEHRDICVMDENILREVLGSDVTLDVCMMDGHHKCSFVIGGLRVVGEGADKEQGSNEDASLES